VTDRWYGHRYELTHELYPEARLFVGETGGFLTTRPTAPQEYCRWCRSIESVDYIVGSVFFLWESPYGDHWQNDLSRNPEIAKALRALAIEDGSQPGDFVIGQGFRRMVPYIGAFVEHQLYHLPGTAHEASLAIAVNGYATWDPVTNETLAHGLGGEVWTDRGNQGDGVSVWRLK
jgi:hypothetical protein